MPTIEKKNCEIEIKATVDDSGTFEGFAATYDTVDLQGDAISPGAFKKTLSEGSRVLPLLWQHDQSQPIGRVELTDSPKGLIARGKLILSVPRAREAHTLMKEGVVKGLSIGYRTIKEQAAGAVRRLKEIALYEVSLVTIAANPEAAITSVKAQDPAGDMEVLNAFRNAARDVRDFHARLIDG
jgi:HK97 family phage prohead protease